MIAVVNDAYFMALLQERVRLQKELAPILTRAGGSNKDRVAVNKRRAALRKDLRRKIKFNAFHMAAHLSEHAADGSLPDTLRTVLHAYVYGDNEQSVSDDMLNRFVDRLGHQRRKV
jgi:hypothetical protein